MLRLFQFNLKNPLIMSIKYRVIERGEPGVAGGGTKKFYANTVTQGELDIEELTERIEKISTVSGADIRAVLYSLVDVIPTELDQGRIVRLGDVGSMRVSISSRGEATAEEVSSASIRGGKIIFSPGRKLKRMLNNLEYSKVE